MPLDTTIVAGDPDHPQGHIAERELINAVEADVSALQSDKANTADVAPAGMSVMVQPSPGAQLVPATRWSTGDVADGQVLVNMHDDMATYLGSWANPNLQPNDLVVASAPA